MKCLRLYCWSLASLSCLVLVNVNGSTSSEAKQRFTPPGLSLNKFVSAAPLIVAAVCSDGVAMIAAHTSADEEPLLYHDCYQPQQRADDDSETIATEQSLLSVNDLPETYGGPFRVHAIDACGTTLLCAGWRADCEIVAQKCRAIAQSETARFGPQISRLLYYYGHVLATELSFYMAQCAVSERVRGLSCVSLLITPGACDGPGHLWLVDETGAYPVRAHCVGGGLRTDENDTTVANRLNSKLAASDFSTMTSQDGIRHLLGLLTGREDDAEKAGRREPLVKEGTRLEVAIVDSSTRKLTRIRPSTLLQNTN